ncbi:hypothetical protein JAAARDRAFT_145597 [Jaapia argillacea MUCL 33604]|uniref:Uncharacterized protein n=1 Tax=Jaapia argillacea MUCL 33604 TaxID=933084 RepID=A0A067QM85_9AGAM|nr:hypothetical protein JAAARDRAFT_145597 [Jaapia argillacea MUCL 33604]
MPTSELSDALNPYIVQPRSRNAGATLHQPPPLAVQQPQPYIPHRSELELAISEPPPPTRPRLQETSEPNSINAVRELFRVLAATKEAAEIERKRRLAWEQEQEAKYIQRQAEMERQMLEMRQEIASLRAYVGLLPQTTHTLQPPIPQYQVAPLPPLTPLSPISQPSSHHQPTFVEGCSSRPLINYHTNSHELSIAPFSPELEFMEPSPSMSHSTRFNSVAPSQSEASAPSSSRRRKRSPDPPTDGDDEDSGSESEPPERPLKRANHHDKRCLTIKHAMRLHILRVMGVETDQDLPASHFEGTPLGPDEPVRFVWEKTPKQSEHNALMKKRVLEDMKSHRKLYKHVPDSDFSKKTLDTTFDQAFTTFRQKFKAQKDASVTLSLKMKEEQKAIRSRRNHRKKNKLNNRKESRQVIDAFAHSTFDGALQMECMSSEESFDDDSEGGGGAGQERAQILRVRGLPWRSTRIQKFFGVLDDDDKLEKSMKPRRGNGRKERCLGPPKNEFCMPPKGVASWMISRRWIRAMEMSHPDLLELLKDVIVDPPGFDWNQFHGLGEESGDEVAMEGLAYHHSQQQDYTPNHCNSSYSLQYALAPVA